MPTASPAPSAKNLEVRKWKGLNRTDARTDIGEDELYDLVNAMSIGAGAVQILPNVGTPIATPPGGVRSTWGFTLNGLAEQIVVGLDGRLSQVATPAGTITPIASAGTVSLNPHLTIWRASHILILDPDHGYMSWDGASFVTIDAGKTGTAVAVFEARAWLAKGRTIEVTAPNTYDDFDPAHGATSFIITDEAFVGDVVAMVSAIEQLWVLGQSGIEAIANVQTISTPVVLTTFSITNIVADLGTTAAQTARGYFRALTFLTPFGEYALAGVTPQKLSDKLDGLFPDLRLDADVTAAVAIVQSLPVLCLRVLFNDPETGPRPILLCFTQGKWFTARQGDSLRWITTVIVDGVSQAWGTDGARLYQLFGAPLTTPTPYVIASKLFALGSAVTEKATTKVGFEFQAPEPINPSVYIDSESGSVLANLQAFNRIQYIVNDVGELMTLVNDLGEPLIIITTGLILAKVDVAQFGDYLGFTIRGLDPPYRLQAFELEYHATDRSWNYP